jgi:ribonuclease VapC
MSKSSVVLDTSALLALMHRELGSVTVRDFILANGGEISSVNLAELVSKQLELGIPSQDTISMVQLTGTNIHVFDSECAALTGALRTATKSLRLSLGDHACLALGIKLKLPVLTADRVWSQLQLDGLEIIQIR